MSNKKLHDYFLNYPRKTNMGNEIGQGEVEGGRVYSVIRKVDNKQVSKFEHPYKYQWGIFVTNDDNRITMTYNLHTPDTWHYCNPEKPYTIPESYHIFRAEWVDRCFALTERECTNLKGRLNLQQKMLNETKLKLNRLQSNPLIRFISKFIK